KYLIIFLLIPFASLKAQDNLQHNLDELIAASVKADAISGNVIIARHDSIIYKNTAGYADWENKTAINDSTLFNIGSLGKDFTKTLVIQLDAEHKLQINDPLSKYLSIFPDSIGKKI